MSCCACAQVSERPRICQARVGGLGGWPAGRLAGRVAKAGCVCLFARGERGAWAVWVGGARARVTSEAREQLATGACSACARRQRDDRGYDSRWLAVFVRASRWVARGARGAGGGLGVSSGGAAQGKWDRGACGRPAARAGEYDRHGWVAVLRWLGRARCGSVTCEARRGRRPRGEQPVRSGWAREERVARAEGWV